MLDGIYGSGVPVWNQAALIVEAFGPIIMLGVGSIVAAIAVHLLFKAIIAPRGRSGSGGGGSYSVGRLGGSAGGGSLRASGVGDKLQEGVSRMRSAMMAQQKAADARVQQSWRRSPEEIEAMRGEYRENRGALRRAASEAYAEQQGSKGMFHDLIKDED